jgi:energy-coupling factor transporter ATP-binding protein EcfA2
MATVQLDHVSKSYGAGPLAVDGVDLSVADGEFMVLLGPSGCGKSTTLRMIAGIESITSGRLSINGRVVNDVPARDRDIAMVFQSYALYRVAPPVGAETGNRPAGSGGFWVARARAVSRPQAGGTVRGAAATSRPRPRNGAGASGFPVR